MVLRLLRRMRPDCFKTSVRCGVEALPPECRRFSTLAEQAVPTLFILTARQGVGKSFLAMRLYERLTEEGRGVLPAVLCGSEKLTRDFEQELFISLSRAFSDFLVKARGVKGDLKTSG